MNFATIAVLVVVAALVVLVIVRMHRKGGPSGGCSCGGSSESHCSGCGSAESCPFCSHEEPSEK